MKSGVLKAAVEDDEEKQQKARKGIVVGGLYELGGVRLHHFRSDREAPLGRKKRIR